MKTLTTKQERFCVNYFTTGNATASAIQAGYSPKTAVVIASQNLTNLKVVTRLQELRDKSASAKIMSVTERMERLTEIARARLTDYQEAGADGGGYINLGKESPNTAAIAGIKSATKFDENGNTGTLYTEIKLHNPIQAISELNKMGGDYAPTNNEKQNLNVNVNVGVFQAKDLTDDQLLDIINRGGGHRAIEQKASKESATAILPVHDVNIREGEASIPSS